MVQPDLSQGYNHTDFDETSATSLRLTWQPTKRDWHHLNNVFSKNNYDTDFVRWNTHNDTDSNTQTNVDSGLFTTATIPYIRGTSETIARILQPYNMPVAYKPITTLRRLLTNVKDKYILEDRQEAIYKIKHWDSATSITYSTDYYQRLTLESWFTNLEQTPLNRSQQSPAPYKRLIDEIKEN